MSKISLKRFKELMTVVIESMNDNGDIYTGILAEDDSLFTVFESWESVHKIYTLTALLSGKYHFYKKACQHALNTNKEWDKPKFIQYYDKKIQLLEDLRLGEHGLFPYDDNALFLVPESLQPYEEITNELLGDWGFSDEYSTCSNCGKILRTSPDSYCWTPDYIQTEDGELFCMDCIDLNDILEEYANKLKSLPYEIQKQAINQDLLIELDFKYENGLHSGMNDDPKIIIKTFKKAGIDLWFNVNPSQFYVEFTILVNPENKESAIEILSHLDVYQGYDTASEMSKALSGKHSDYITKKTYTISQEDFIKGNLPHDGDINEYRINNDEN